MPSYLFRMKSGIAGNVNRDSQNTIEPQRLSKDSPFDAYGVPGKIVDGFFAPLAEGDSAADIYGWLVRPYPTQDSVPNPGFNGGKPGVPPYGGNMADVLRRGYMSVVNRAGTPGLNQPVYVRVANATAAQPIGGVEATAVDGETVAVNGAIFMDSGDADGNVEISFNI